MGKYKDREGYELWDLWDEWGWEEGMRGIEDDGEKKLIRIIDIGGGGKGRKEMVDYMGEKEIVKKGLC